MAVDSDTTLSIRKTETARFLSTDTADFLAIPVWADAAEYKVDQQVITIDTGTGENWSQWVARVDHTSKTADHTSGSASAAGTLASSLWEKVQPGLIYTVQSLDIDYPTSETSTK